MGKIKQTVSYRKQIEEQKKRAAKTALILAGMLHSRGELEDYGLELTDKGIEDVQKIIDSGFEPTDEELEISLKALTRQVKAKYEELEALHNLEPETTTTQ